MVCDEIMQGHIGRHKAGIADLELATDLHSRSRELNPDQQIRMKALECASRRLGQDVSLGFWEAVAEFEDYLRNGRRA